MVEEPNFNIVKNSLFNQIKNPLEQKPKPKTPVSEAEKTKHTEKMNNINKNF